MRHFFLRELGNSDLTFKDLHVGMKLCLNTSITIRCNKVLPRDAGAGGGAVGASCSHKLEAVGHRPPQLWTVNVVHFYLVFVFACEIVSLPKYSGPNAVSF